MVKAMARGGLGDPLGRFAVGPHQQGLGAALGDQVGQRLRATEHQSLRHGDGLLQPLDAVQVRVHGDDCIEQPGQKPAHHLLAHGLAGVECDVLPHIGQVRRHQCEVLNTQAAGSAGGQQQLHQFFVGLVQAAQQYGLAGQLA